MSTNPRRAFSVYFMLVITGKIAKVFEKLVPRNEPRLSKPVCGYNDTFMRIHKTSI